MWARVVLGLAGLVGFGAFAVGDARALQARRGVPVAWALPATGASILAGFAHLALTPGHWEESVGYGVFFLAAGLVQLLLASAMGRPVRSGHAGRPVRSGHAGRPVRSGHAGRPVRSGHAGRPTAGDWVWPAAAAVNLSLVGVYVASRLVAPFGSDLPEPVDAIGVVTVVAEVVAAAASVLVGRRLSPVSPPR